MLVSMQEGTHWQFFRQLGRRASKVRRRVQKAQAEEDRVQKAPK